MDYFVSTTFHSCRKEEEKNYKSGFYFYSQWLALARTTDAQRANSLHCTAENSIPIPNFKVWGQHILSATSAQFFRYLWFMPSLGVRSPWHWPKKITLVCVMSLLKKNQVSKSSFFVILVLKKSVQKDIGWSLHTEMENEMTFKLEPSFELNISFSHFWWTSFEFQSQILHHSVYPSPYLNTHQAAACSGAKAVKVSNSEKH